MRTEGFVKEQEAGRMLFKGAFSSGNPTGGRVLLLGLWTGCRVNLYTVAVSVGLWCRLEGPYDL